MQTCSGQSVSSFRTYNLNCGIIDENSPVASEDALDTARKKTLEDRILCVISSAGSRA